jgi:hypothetical protein
MKLPSPSARNSELHHRGPPRRVIFRFQETDLRWWVSILDSLRLLEEHVPFPMVLVTQMLLLIRRNGKGREYVPRKRNHLP